MTYEPRELERKWQQRWAEGGRYEADPDADADATFVTVPYPYPSGGMHIGHARTYTVPDVYARYRRLQGDNVLFPIAWHVTGTPIIGAVNRLQKGEEKQLSVLRDTYGVPEDQLKDLETPMGFARYFVENHYKQNMQALGLSVDWRREFTTNDERYSKFITWQYETLRDHGRLEKGLHPVKYCTDEENPVTTHDILEGENAEQQEYTLIKFEQGERFLPMATLRPETVRGVTNAFVKPDGDYVEATVDGETWVVSQDAVRKLRLQERDVEVVDGFQGEALVGERVTNPVTGDEILLLPADFVDPDNATGVVMSVPAHSPDDYVALQEVKGDPYRLTPYGIDPDEVDAIDPVGIIDVQGYGEWPAKDAVEEYGIESSTDPSLHDATQEVYNREFHAGYLKEMYGEYAGELVEDARDDLKAHFQAQGEFDAMYDFTEEVICRCGGEVEVAKQETWFLTYNDQDWKETTKQIIAEMDAIPENTRDQYTHTVDWLNEWPCIRNYGLGTRLPWDDEFVIEPLSDSTIYMSYYTMAHRLDDIPTENLTREFFDALFYGPDAIEGEAPQAALDLREEWDYWYPVDYRVSANDLISNHLTFYLFHHADIFDRPNWPQGITIMGMGLLEGEKMSSSKGHVVLPADAIEEFGADTVRFFLLNSAEPWQDFDWRRDEVQTTHDQLARFYTRAKALVEDPEGSTSAEQPSAEQSSGDEPREVDLERIDRWLLSKLQDTVRTATAAMENFETRKASQEVFYRFEEDLRWYRRRTDTDRPGARWTHRRVLETRLRMLAPVMPFMTNDLHERLTGTPAEDAAWPEPDSAFESARVEVEEALVEGLTEDVRDIINVTDTQPERIRVFTAADWKYRVFDTVAEVGADDRGQIMGEVMQYDSLRAKGEQVNQLVGDLVDSVREYDHDALVALRELDEDTVYEEAAGFLAREFDATVDVIPEDEADEEKAGQATPFRPAILLD